MPRTPNCSLDFEGESVPAVAGEPVAVALYAARVKVLSRSIKYHRPRTFFCLAGHCGACLMRVDGMPNVKACKAPVTPGLAVSRQNAFPSAGFDVLAAADLFFPTGMDHHTMMTSPRALNALLQKVVRELGGLGELPDPDNVPRELPAGERKLVDVAVIGGGPAGLAAAIAIRRARPRTNVMLVDEGALGGSLGAWPGGTAKMRKLVDEARSLGVELRARATVMAWYPEDEGGLLAVEDHGHLLRLSAARYIHATGGYDTNALFPDNDRPGILAARAVGTLLETHGVVAGKKPIVLGEGEYADALAAALTGAGATVARVDGVGMQVVGASGHAWVRGLTVEENGVRKKIKGDSVAVVTTPAPASDLARQHGVSVILDEKGGGFACVVDADGLTSVPGVYACGDVTGYRGPTRAEADGARTGLAVARSLEGA